MGKISTKTGRDREKAEPIAYDEGLRLELIQTELQAQQLAIELAKYDVVAMDFETNAKRIQDPDFKDVGVSFAVDEHRAWYIPYGHEEPIQNSLFAPPLEQLPKQYVMEMFRFVWRDKKVVGHNLKYEAHVLYNNGENVKYYNEGKNKGGLYFDTFIAQVILDDRELSFGLKALVRKYLNRKALTLSQVLGKGRKDFTQVPLDIALNYAAPDSSNSFALYKLLSKELEKSTALARGSRNVFWNFEMPLVNHTMEMEHVGFRLDEEHLNYIHQQTTEKCEAYYQKMTKILEDICPDFDVQFGQKFDPSKKDTVASALLEVLAVPTPRMKADKFDTDRAQLESILEAIKLNNTYKKLFPKGEEFVENMLAWRKEEKIRSTYTHNLLDQRINGILYPEFNQVGTKSGRGSSKNPNGQNLPGSKDQYHIRKALLPPFEDWVWVVADYRNMEIYITAALSKCPVLKPMVCGEVTIFDDLPVKVIDPHKHYEEKVTSLMEEDNIPEDKAKQMAAMLDMHRYTASVAFNVPYDKVTKAQRNDAKPVNFGIIYGITEVGLAAQLNVSVKRAKELITGFMKAYPGVARWIQENNEEVFRNKKICTQQGRFRHVPHWALNRPKNHYVGIFRWATNHKVQGDSGYKTKEAMIKIARWLKEHPEVRGKMTFQIHDEIICAAHKDDANIVGDNMVRLMNTYIDEVPIVTDGYQIKTTLDKG